jgi:hypothetical protein
MRSLVSISAVAAGLSLLAAGCGSGSPSGVASLDTTTTAVATTPGGAQAAAVAFARCMRSHGVPNWPDPVGAGVFDKSTLARLVPDPSRMRALQAPCEHLLPDFNSSPPPAGQPRAQLADELSFARCMRHHGVARFPDPSVQNGLTVEMVEAQGIDVHSPIVLRVVQRCIPASHGALTAAKIRQAIQNAGH